MFKTTLNKILLYVACTSLAFAISSCDPSEFGDLNDNPNSTTVPITSALLTNAISQMDELSNTAASYAQYVAETQYPGVSLYDNVFGTFGNHSGPLYDLQNIINNNTDPATAEKVLVDGSNNNQIAVARIMKTWYFMYETDQFGDIPYSQALIGEAQPAYDTQESIYEGMFKELDEAVKQFDGGLAAKGDILFGGNITKWKKFANTLRLILALRVSDVKPDQGKTQFNAALNADGGVIESNSDNVTLNYPGGGFNNPWFNTYNGRKDWAISDVIANTLAGLGDPRLNSYGQPNSSGAVVPVPYGVTRDEVIAYTNAHPDFSFVMAQKFRNDNSPFVFLSASHAYLARAEAAQRGWTGENATTMYNAGIKAAWEQWQVFNQDAYDAYIAKAEVSLASGNPLEKIGTQRWIAFYPDGHQGWAEWRRTGFPALTPTPNATNTSKQIPRRYRYPTTEPNLNKPNYDAAAQRIGGDTQETKVWWDK